MKTLYITDLDGTLLNSESKISDRSRQLLNEAAARGVNFSIATARTPATVSEIIQGTDFRIPLIVMTGAAVWDPKTNRYSEQKYMNPDSVRNLIECYHKMEFPIFLYTLNHNMIDIYHLGGKLNPLEQQFMEERMDSPFKNFHIDPTGGEIIPEDLSHTILFYAIQPAEHSKATYAESIKVEGIRPQFYYDFYGPEIGILEAFSPLATKAYAVLDMKKRLGADRVVVFGDNLNDIPMFEVADLAVAVENALPEVKAKADIIIGPNTADSVAEFIYNNLGESQG